MNPPSAIDQRLAIRRRAIELGLAGLHDLLHSELIARHERVRFSLLDMACFCDLPETVARRVQLAQRIQWFR
jgi:hypothetical protein